MKKFLSDVLVDCNLTVSGTTVLGAATGVTVATADDSANLATTAWVKDQGYVSTNTTYDISVPSGTTNIRLASSGGVNDDITISAAGASTVSRVSDSEIRITSVDSVDYISNVTLAGTVLQFTGVGNGFAENIDLASINTDTNYYLNSATFNTTNGVLTLGRQGLSDITVDLDNRYLTSEADTLDTVTSRNGVTTNAIGVGTVNVTGSTAGAELLTVDGTYGRLFTVTDDLSDSLFSVNTIAGLPALEVFADNTIKLGAFANPITIDSSSNISIPGTITASGYNDSNWNTAFNDRITAAAVSGTSTKTLTLTQGDGSTLTASWTDIEGTGADGYVSNVALNGNSLDFTAVGSGFAGSIDLSTITSNFNATDVVTVYERVKNVAGGPLQKGTPLAVVPGQTSGNISDVIPADASDPARMPAVFILNEDLADQAEGDAVVYGNITGIDTSAFDSGTTVYVAPGGGWTADKPQGDNLIQNLGIITKSHPTNGGGVVMGAGRSNDVPNIPNGYAWVGNANGVATPTLLGSLAYSSATYDNYVSWNLKTNGVQRTTVQSGGNLDIVAGTNVSVSYGAGGVVTISSTDTNTDTNNYVTGLSFNTTTGVLTATRQGLGDLTVDLDGRYLTSYTETDTLATVAARGASTTTNLSVGPTLTLQKSSRVARLSTTLDGGNDPQFIEFNESVSNSGYIWISVSDDFDIGSTADVFYIGDSSINTTTNWRFKLLGSGDAYLKTSGGDEQIATRTWVTNQSYLTSFSESDPIFTASAAAGITATNISNWNTAYGWGNHSTQGYLTSETLTELSVANNILSYRDETGAVTEIDLNIYLDDTNLARLTSGTLNGTTGIATFTRDDATTFTVDFSAFLADANNYVDALSFNTTNGVLTVGRNGSLADLTVDLDGRYLTGYTESDTLDSVTNRGNSTTNSIAVAAVALAGDDNVTITANGAIGNPVPVVIETFNAAANLAAFMDYVIYNTDKSAMRAGTVTIVFNADELRLTEVATQDIGGTDGCFINANVTSATCTVTFEAPDPSFKIKYQLRTL